MPLPLTHEDVERVFDSFVKKAAENRRRDYYKCKEGKPRREISLNYLTPDILNEHSAWDKYSTSDNTFPIFGMDISIDNEYLAEALRLIPQYQREVILLSYIIGLNDQEIAQELNKVRRTIQHTRSKALEKLKIIMEALLNEN